MTIVYRTQENQSEFDRLLESTPQDFTLLEEERTYKSRSLRDGWNFYYMSMFQVQGATETLILLKYPEWRQLI